MMRVQFRQRDGEIVLQVCGRLAEGFVGELEKTWRAARSENPGARLSVDLRSVTFIDQAGERLLKTMHSDGASFLAGGLLVKEVVSHVTGGSR